MEQEYQFTPTELEQLNGDIELNASLGRLMKNRDFKKLVLDMYLRDGAVLLTKNLWKVKSKRDANMSVIDDAFIARSLLYGFFEDIERNANDAVEALSPKE